ncbi:MAG: hypothetical protein CVV41_04310 [Candidatus Riflebacteria bacterium HGW-Riflebacteria-1]|jgi:anti-anti-sigma factor|nr:MAG: hypothetical protein CVV41_04310 [Candidatus Riflebacteria bacterium HGW-Riflebacteria-1]
MLFKVENVESSQVVKVTDSIFFDAVQEFDQAVQQAEESGSKKVIIDLTGVEMICSSAITTIVKHHMSLKNKGARLVVAGCNQTMLRIVQLLGLNKLMSFADDLQTAIKL